MINPEHYLLITAIGPNKVGHLDALSQLCQQCGCNIVESKMNNYGDTFGAYLWILGTWHTIAKLEASLPNFAVRFQLHWHTRRTTGVAIPSNPWALYHVQVTALDQPGILHQLLQFFTQEQVLLEELSCETHVPYHSHSRICTFNLVVKLSTKIHLANFRESFMLYCDDRNLDAIIELKKH